MANNLEPLAQGHEDILHQVFDLSSQGFQVINREWKYVYVNKAVAEQGKSTQEKLLGHTMMEMYPGIEKTPLFAQLERCMNEKVNIRMENPFTFPDGSSGWFQLFIHPWSDGIIIFSVDITARKKEEELLVKKIEELEKVFNKTPEEKKKIEELREVVAKIHRQEPMLI